jgi:hypothetical protein
VAILTVVVGLLVVTCGFLLAFALYRGQRTIEILKAEYLIQTAEMTAREVTRIPRVSAQVLNVQQRQIESGVYSTADPVALARAFAGALEADRRIKWVSYSEDATGRFFGAARIKGDEVILNLSDPRQNRGIPRELRADTLRPHVRTPPPSEPYDPRTRDWYRNALQALPGVIRWTPPYKFAEGDPGMTAALAARDATGKALGVVTVDFTLDGVNEFLRGMKLDEEGVLAVYDSRGALIGGVGPPPALQALSGWRKNPKADTERVQHGSVKIAKERWSVAAMRVPDARGLEWTAATALPDRVILGPVYANRRGAIVIALIGIGIAVLLGIVVATGMSRSIVGVSGALERIARFDLEDVAHPSSAIREIAQLQARVGGVIATLRSFSRYAPEEIVRDVV